MAEDFQGFVLKVKEVSPIEDVIEETGPEFKVQRKHGNYLRCEGENNDLVIRVDEQYYVWNKRSEKGDVFNWVMARRNFDFWEALRFLADRAKIEIPAQFLPKDDQPTRLAARLQEDVFGIAQRIMSGWLWQDAEALAYVRSRGLTDETIKSAGLGFSGRATAAQVKDLRGELQMYQVDLESPAAAAIIGFEGDVKGWGQHWKVKVPDNWIQWRLVPSLIYKTRLVYPHWEGGRVVYLSSRNILGAELNKEGREIKGYNLPVALAGDRRPFFNHVYGRRAEECVVIEGQMDAITLGQWNIPAVALAGTSWADHTDLLLELRKRHDRFYLGLDADQAGVNALVGMKGDWPLAQIYGPMGRVVRWPESQGPDPSITASNGDASTQGARKIGKDANDWLKFEMAPSYRELEKEEHETEDPEALRAIQEGKKKALTEQEKKAGELLRGSLTFVEEMAKWAGGLKGAERDEGIKIVFQIIAKMDQMGRAQYRSRLSELLKISVREFNDILKAAGQASDDEKPMEFRETLGGFIEGWLIEYVYDPEEDKARLAFRDPDKRIGVADWIDIEGVRYVPKRVVSFIRDGGVLFASELGQLKSTRELVAIVEAFIARHYLLETQWLSRIIAYYVLLTWVYDSFNALCYLRAMGEAGSGKSELMKRVGHLCYRMMTASGANTAASFFRATEMYRGTVFIDEADLHDGGDMSNDLVKFLNLGAMKDNPIWRLEEVNGDNGKTYEVATFSTFCPKLIAMRKDFKDDAVGTRSLTIKLMPREAMELVEKGVKLTIDDEFREKSRKIRNMLLRWRFAVWEPEIPLTEDLIDFEISSRLNQVTMPLKALAKDDDELRDEIERFLRAYNREIVLTRSMTIAARVVEAMWKIHCYSDLRQRLVQHTAEGDEFMMIGDVRTIANEIMDEMNAVGEDDDEDDKPKKRKKDELSARGVGHIIRNELQLQVGERRGSGFPVFWEDLKLRALGKRYGVDYEKLIEKMAPEQKELL